jgi:hypothetical protein
LTAFDLTPTLTRPRQLADLFEATTRALLPRSFGGVFPGAGKIGLNIQYADHHKVNTLESSELWEYGRVSVSRRDIVRDDLQPFAPLIARKHFIPFHVDMIPSTSFGASLANILTQESWKAVRKASFVNAGYSCQICGEANGPVEGHEVWQFHDQFSDKRGWGIQSLETILCLCSECHEMFHPGLANVRGRSEAMIARSKAVNGWTDQEYNKTCSYSNERHQVRNRRNWSLDLTKSGIDLCLAIKPNWSRSEQGILSAKTKYGAAETMLMGVRYQAGGQVFYEPPIRGRQ